VILFKMLLETQHFVVWTIVALILSCFNFVAWELIQSFAGLYSFPEYYGVWSTTLASPNVWLGMALAVAACLSFDLAAKFYNRQSFPSRWMILQEKYAAATETLKTSIKTDRDVPLLVRETTEEIV